MSEYNIKECRKIIQQYREERLKSKDSYILNLRLKALNRLNKNVRALAEDGFDIRIVLGITRKKTEIISHIVCDSEAEILALDSCPRYDGEKYGDFDYNAHKFFFSCFAYGSAGDEITAAMARGDEDDVKTALCGYVIRNEYNPKICDYIRSRVWLENTNKRLPFVDILSVDGGVAG